MFSIYKNKTAIVPYIRAYMINYTNNSSKQKLEYFQNKKYNKLLNIDKDFTDKSNDISIINEPNLEIITAAASENSNFYGSFLLLSVATCYFYYMYNKLKKI